MKVPRNRNGEYEPQIIGKYRRNADGMEEKILGLYACGMSQWFWRSSSSCSRTARLPEKRAESKPYRVYMVASANKFLRIYAVRLPAQRGAGEISQTCPEGGQR